MKIKEKNKRSSIFEQDDRPGEAEKRERMRALYGENKVITGEYDKDASVSCVNGIFVGKNKDGIMIFKGIPYAKPPVNELRWKPPVEAEKSDTVREAYYYGHSPIQTQWPSEEGSYYPNSEDCLTLNVWTSGKSESKKAVMVFFHGGSYGWGATSDPIYDGFNLVKSNKDDIVLVTVEYRVGVMGFVDFSEVEGGEEYKYSGNLGLLDHVCALKWVHENIEAFGGDKDNVTIFGESAGGGTVSLLPLLDSAKGLFRRVIAESGSVALTYSREECLGLAKRLLNATGCKNMAQLCELSEEDLMEVNKELNDYNNFPERDGIVLPYDLYGAYESGKTKDIDIMIGTNADECRYWIREMGYYTKDWLGFTVFKLGVPLMYNTNRERMSEHDKQLAESFISSIKGRRIWGMVEFYNDILFRAPAIEQASLHSQNGGNAYMYFWTYPSAHKRIGACHAVELAYVFNNLKVRIYTGNNINYPLAQQVQKMWVNFAKTGNPSTDKFYWEPYDTQSRKTAFLGKSIKLVRTPMQKRTDIAQPLLKYYFNGCYTNLSFNVPVIYKIMAAITAAVMAVIGLVPAFVIIVIKLIKRALRRRKKSQQ